MKSKYRTEFSGQKRHDSSERTAQTGGDRQVRKTRTRKNTDCGKLNYTIGTWLSRQLRVPPCKTQALYSIAYTNGYSPRVL